MTPQEFARVVQMVRAFWPGAPLSADNVKAYGAVLEDLDYESVKATIEAMSREGRERIPPPGVVRRKYAEMVLDAPTWAEVHRALNGITGAGYGGFYGLSKQREHMLDDLHPLVREFCDATGAKQVYESINQGGDGEARLRGKWEGFVRDRVDQTALAGIQAPPVLKRIERANSDGDVKPVAGVIEGVVKALQPGSPEDG
jgi:hypothetical protein